MVPFQDFRWIYFFTQTLFLIFVPFKESIFWSCNPQDWKKDSLKKRKKSIFWTCKKQNFIIIIVVVFKESIYWSCEFARSKKWTPFWWTHKTKKGLLEKNNLFLGLAKKEFIIIIIIIFKESIFWTSEFTRQKNGLLKKKGWNFFSFLF
jgi:hypothetical protein